MKRKNKRIIFLVLSIEAIAVLIIFTMVILKGKVSFRTIEAMEGSNLQTENQIEGLPEELPGNPDSEEAEVKQDQKDIITYNGNIDNIDNNQDKDITEDMDNSETKDSTENKDSIDNIDNTVNIEESNITEDVYDTIVISAAGDVTLGRDLNFGYERSFDHEFELQENDYSYFFQNVKHIFEKDDITIVNLETTLTTANKPAEKKFRFKADPSYVEILRAGDIEAVSIANNHSHDYLEQGYVDTLKTLDSGDIGYFGYEHRYIKEVRGIKIGIAGFVSWEVSENQKDEIGQAIDDLREKGADIVIFMFHWGIERDYSANSVQKELAHYTIDRGADLILGSHPHVLQEIEEYNGKNIVYSMGNFSFGGNKNPSDKDSMVYVHRFNFKNGVMDSQESEAIPCSISSVQHRNNYQPTPLEGEEKDRVLGKIIKSK
ncbi:MAG TPA: CapA family protein [Mobilitalea sp.]|nr:CapA family protein [Mobilitalea sp.]